MGQTELRHNGVLRSWCLPEELEEDDPDRYGKVEAVRHPSLWDGHSLVAQRQHFRSDASTLRAEHDDLLRAEREAGQRSRMLVGYGSHLATGERGEERLGLLYPFEGDAEKKAPAEMVLIWRVRLLP
jgi:hypothetical protein